MKKLAWIGIGVVLAGCARSGDSASTSAAAVDETQTPSFAKNLAVVNHFSEAFPAWSVFEGKARFANALNYDATVTDPGPSMPIFAGDCAKQCTLGFMDSKSVFTSRGAPLPFNGKPLLSEDGEWFAYVAATGVVLAQVHATSPINQVFPRQDVDDPWTAPRFVGNALVMRNSKRIAAFDPASHGELWSVALPLDSEPPDHVVSADGTQVLLYTHDWARIVDVASGASHPVADWSTIGFPSCTPSWDKDNLVVKAYPTGFVVQRGPTEPPESQTVKYADTVALVESNGAVAVVSTCADAHAVSEAGAIAARTDHDSGKIAIHAPGIPDATVTLSLTDRLAWSADGQWVTDGFSVVNADGKSPTMTVTAPSADDIKTPIFRNHFSEAFAEIREGNKVRLERWNFAAGTHPVVHQWEVDPEGASATTVEPEGNDPVAFTSFDIPGSFPAAKTEQRLIDAKGTVLKKMTMTLDDAKGYWFQQELGWSGGVLYFTAYRPSNSELTLRGLSRDGKVDVEIIPQIDEMVVERTKPEANAPIARIIVHGQSLLYTFTPSPYVASVGPILTPPVTGDDDDDIPTTTPKHGDDPQAPAAPSKPAANSKMGAITVNGCSSAPGSTSGGSALALLTLCLATAARRRSASRSRS